jgi:hypothetical protein
MIYLENFESFHKPTQDNSNVLKLKLESILMGDIHPDENLKSIYKGLPENTFQKNKIAKSIDSLYNEGIGMWEYHLQQVLNNLNQDNLIKENQKRVPRKEGQKRNSPNHSDLYTDENPEGTIHGLGFKDKETAKESIEIIKNIDRTHQHKVLASLVMKQRCKVAIDRTKDPEKKSNLKEAFEVWSNFLEDMKEKTEKLKNENLLVRHDLERVDEGFSDFYRKVKDNINSFDLKERIKEKISDLTETALKNTSNEKLKNELENVRVEFEKLPNEEKQKIKSKLKTFFKEEKNENRTTDKESEELKVKKPKKEKKYNTLTNQILDYFGLSMTSIGFVGSVVSMILTVMGKGLQEVVLNMEVGEIGGVFMVMTLLGGVIKGLFGKIDD